MRDKILPILALVVFCVLSILGAWQNRIKSNIMQTQQRIMEAQRQTIELQRETITNLRRIIDLQSGKEI
jgi:hypothetical protein